jgi:hypothetical protein
MTRRIKVSGKILTVWSFALSCTRFNAMQKQQLLSDNAKNVFCCENVFCN